MGIEEIIGPALSALPATSLIAFYGWFQADRRCEAISTEYRALSKDYATMIGQQSAVIQKVSDSLDDVTAELKRIHP